MKPFTWYFSWLDLNPLSYYISTECRILTLQSTLLWPDMHYSIDQLICLIKALSPSTSVRAFPLQSTEHQELKKDYRSYMPFLPMRQPTWDQIYGWDNNESRVLVLDNRVAPYNRVSIEVKGLFIAFTGVSTGLEELKSAHSIASVSLLLPQWVTKYHMNQTFAKNIFFYSTFSSQNNDHSQSLCIYCISIL
jgi:hypothetical protein